MTRRTLAEAAAEILAASKSSAPSAGGPQKPDIDAGNNVSTEIQDLGGSTIEKPDGGEVSTGKAASNAMSEVQDKIKQSAQVGQMAAEPVPSGEPIQAVKAKVEPPMMEGTTEEGELTEEEAKVAREAMIRSKIQEMSVDEDMTALFAGSDLSEDFKKKAKTIFEAAVVARSVKVVEELEAGILQAAEESVEEIKEELEGKVNSYLDYVTEEWKKENVVAIESNLRNQITEEFVGGLKKLFLEHNINLPEEQVNVVEQLQAQVEQLQSQINETLNNNIELKKQINEAKKVEMLTSVCEGLTATQVEKIKTLAEGVEFTTEGEYREKLSIIREQYFTQVKPATAPAKTVVTEDAPVITEELKGPMAAYVSAIARTKIA